MYHFLSPVLLQLQPLYRGLRKGILFLVLGYPVSNFMRVRMHKVALGMPDNNFLHVCVPNIEY